MTHNIKYDLQPVQARVLMPIKEDKANERRGMSLRGAGE